MVTPPPKKGNSNKIFRVILFVGLFVLVFVHLFTGIADYVASINAGASPSQATSLVSGVFAQHLFQFLLGCFAVVLIALAVKVLYMIAAEELNFDKLVKKGWAALTSD